MRFLVFAFLSISTFLFSTPITDHRIDPAALEELAKGLGIASESNLIEETQKRWLRKPHQERWEMQELSMEERDFVLNWGKEHGLFAEWRPSLEEYDKACILGATTYKMEERLAYLKTLWENGIRFHEIVWLTGERALDERVDDLTKYEEDESKAALRIWEKADLPEAMRKLPVVFISVPMKEIKGSYKRPNTKDTLLAWLGSYPEPCSALFVSDQPFCGYQFAIVKSTLPTSFLFDVVGKGVSPYGHPLAAAITLDSIARWIYQENLSSSEK